MMLYYSMLYYIIAQQVMSRRHLEADRGKGERVWVLDPIDGTKGFMTGQAVLLLLLLSMMMLLLLVMMLLLLLLLLLLLHVYATGFCQEHVYDAASRLWKLDAKSIV